MPILEIAEADTLTLSERGTGGAATQAPVHGTGWMPECGNPACSSGWTKMWRRKATPIFEGTWMCSEVCLRERVMKMLRLDASSGKLSDANAPHTHRIPLGLLLLAQGWVTQPQLRQALEAQQRSGRGRIGTWLMDEFGVKESQITQALSMQWSCPVVKAEGFEPIRMALAAPAYFSEELGAVPLRVAGGKILYLAFEDRVDASAAVAMEKMTGLRVECCLMDGSQVQQARRRLSNAAFAPLKTPVVGDLNALAVDIARRVENARPFESRLARVHNQYWLRMWHRKPGLDSVGDLPANPGAVSDVLYTLDGARN